MIDNPSRTSLLRHGPSSDGTNHSIMSCAVGFMKLGVVLRLGSFEKP